MPKEDSQFNSERGRLAGLQSGISRKPADKEKAANRSLSYAEDLMDLLYQRIMSTALCDKCKRGGPIDVKTFASLASSLSNVIEKIQHRAWGQPARESKFSREASLEDFRRAQREVKAPENDDFVPDDLPSPPNDQPKLPDESSSPE